MENRPVDIQAVPLAEIVANRELQPRVDGIDDRHVRELEVGAEHWPPVSLVVRDKRYVLVDGFHRLQAAKNLKLKSIRASILKIADDADLHAIAFTLNASHGRSLSLKDRRAFAARLLCLHANWSDREIGRQSGLAQPTITKIRAELERQKQIAPARSRVGRDGRSYAVSRQAALQHIGKSIEQLADALDPNEQRRIVRYLQKLVPLLEEQDKLKSFETFDDAARACTAVLGNRRAKEIGQQLGWTSENILGIAWALGYCQGEQP